MRAPTAQHSVTIVQGVNYGMGGRHLSSSEVCPAIVYSCLHLPCSCPLCLPGVGADHNKGSLPTLDSTLDTDSSCTTTKGLSPALEPFQRPLPFFR